MGQYRLWWSLEGRRLPFLANMLPHPLTLRQRSQQYDSPHPCRQLVSPPAAASGHRSGRRNGGAPGPETSSERARPRRHCEQQPGPTAGGEYPMKTEAAAEAATAAAVTAAAATMAAAAAAAAATAMTAAAAAPSADLNPSTLGSTPGATVATEAGISGTIAGTCSATPPSDPDPVSSRAPTLITTPSVAGWQSLCIHLPSFWRSS